MKPEFDKEKSFELVKQEAELLYTLNHPNIVKVRHLVQIDGILYMGMEVLKGGDLRSFIKSRSKLQDFEAAEIMKSILSAVSYIHEKGVIHRDLKTANILIENPEDFKSIKIIDFGFGERNLLTKASYDEHVGTLVYMAPEVAFQQDYTKSVDVWAIGIIMHYLITCGKHPFYDYSDNVDTFKKKLSALKKVDPDPSFSWVAKNLFQRMTMISAHMRYTAKDALRHPWITRRKFDKIPESFMEKMSNI